jgi:hypothetical protein
MYYNLTGRQFGSWYVIGRVDYKPNRVYWKCKCVCGSIRPVATSALTLGYSTCCGCIGDKATSLRRRIHHETNARITPEYRAWSHMKWRVLNPKCPMYYRYGGRGVTICKRWMHSYPNFLKDMGRKPARHYSLDRIDNSKGYSSAICRWATPKQQANNRS